MELNEFVKQSLLQIFEGISEAQKIVTIKHKGFINPVNDNMFRPEALGYLPAFMSKDRLINFDIAIQVSEKENAQAGLTVFSGVFGAGAKAEIENQGATTSRIKFDIPVKFPGQIENRNKNDFL